MSGPVGAIWDRFGPIFFKRLGVDWFTFSPFILLIQKQNTHRPLHEILCWLYCKYYTNVQILVKWVHYIHVCYSCALQAYYLQHLAINREWILWHVVFLKHFGGSGWSPTRSVGIWWPGNKAQQATIFLHYHSSSTLILEGKGLYLASFNRRNDYSNQNWFSVNKQACE